MKKQSFPDALRDMLQHPARFVPTILLSLFWMMFSLMSAFGLNLPPLRFLYTLTYANGGMYGGFPGAVGGIFGKAFFATFANMILLSLIQRQNPFAGMSGGLSSCLKKSASSGTYASGPLITGTGIGMLLYLVFNLTVSPVNCAIAVIGAVAAIRAAGASNGLLFSALFFAAGKLSGGRTPSRTTISRLLLGLSIGFAIVLPMTFWRPRHAIIIFTFGTLIALIGVMVWLAGALLMRLTAFGFALFLAAGTALLPYYAINVCASEADDEISVVSTPGNGESDNSGSDPTPIIPEDFNPFADDSGSSGSSNDANGSSSDSSGSSNGDSGSSNGGSSREDPRIGTPDVSGGWEYGDADEGGDVPSGGSNASDDGNTGGSSGGGSGSSGNDPRIGTPDVSGSDPYGSSGSSGGSSSGSSRNGGSSGGESSGDTGRDGADGSNGDAGSFDDGTDAPFSPGHFIRDYVHNLTDSIRDTSRDEAGEDPAYPSESDGWDGVDDKHIGNENEDGGVTTGSVHTEFDSTPYDPDNPDSDDLPESDAGKAAAAAGTAAGAAAGGMAGATAGGAGASSGAGTFGGLNGPSGESGSCGDLGSNSEGGNYGDYGSDGEGSGCGDYGSNNVSGDYGTGEATGQNSQSNGPSPSDDRLMPGNYSDSGGTLTSANSTGADDIERLFPDYDTKSYADNPSNSNTPADNDPYDEYAAPGSYADPGSSDDNSAPEGAYDTPFEEEYRGGCTPEEYEEIMRQREAYERGIAEQAAKYQKDINISDPEFDRLNKDAAEHRKARETANKKDRIGLTMERKYGGNADDVESLRHAVTDAANREIDSRNDAYKEANSATNKIIATQGIQTAADKSIEYGSKVIPGGKMIESSYIGLRNFGRNISEHTQARTYDHLSRLDDEINGKEHKGSAPSFTDTLTKTAFDTGIDYWQANSKGVSNFLSHTAGEGAKSLYSDMGSDKSAGSRAKDAIKAAGFGAVRWGGAQTGNPYTDARISGAANTIQTSLDTDFRKHEISDGDKFKDGELMGRPKKK